MSYVLDPSAARINRRAALRSGIAAFGLQALGWGAPAASAQHVIGSAGDHYNDPIICPLGEIGFTTDPDCYYYYGTNCPGMDTFYGITSPVRLFAVTGDCPGVFYCDGVADDCANCPSRAPCPPIPCKSLPLIPSKSLPSAAPGATVQRTRDMTLYNDYLPGDPSNPTVHHGFHKRMRPDLSVDGLELLKPGPITLQQHQHAGVFKADQVGAPMLYRVEGSNPVRAVCLLLYKAKRPPRGHNGDLPYFGIGQEVTYGNAAALDPLTLSWRGPRYATGFVSMRDPNNLPIIQCFHILMRR